jgi:hypothetical protein
MLHAQFGSREMLILGLALRETLGDTGVSHAPSKNVTYNDKVYRDKCHKYNKYNYYIEKVLQNK